MLAENAAEEAAAAAALGVKRVGTVDDLQTLDENMDTRAPSLYVPVLFPSSLYWPDLFRISDANFSMWCSPKYTSEQSFVAKEHFYGLIFDSLHDTFHEAT